MVELLPVSELISNHPAHIRESFHPDYEKGAGFVIDKVKPLQETNIPITDLGFMRADAVYDVVTVSRGKFFKLENHQKRFARSCSRMRLTNPYNSDQEAKILNDLVAKTGLKDAFVWWCVTRGSNPNFPSDRLNPNKFNNRFFAFAVPYIFIKEDKDKVKGINLYISQDYIRIPPGSIDPRAKNFCQLDLAMSLFEAGDHGANWSVLSDCEGALVEAPGCNIFVVKDNQISTPNIGCLEGITRETTIELATEMNLIVKTRRVTIEDLQSADEVFLTSSAGGILPVSFLSGEQFGEGVGPITKQIHNLYWKKRWDGWEAQDVDYLGGEN